MESKQKKNEHTDHAHARTRAHTQHTPHTQHTRGIVRKAHCKETGHILTMQHTRTYARAYVECAASVQADSMVPIDCSRYAKFQVYIFKTDSRKNAWVGAGL